MQEDLGVCVFVFGRWPTNDKGEATLRQNVITDVDVGLRAKSAFFFLLRLRWGREHKSSPESEAQKVSDEKKFFAYVLLTKFKTARFNS